MIEEILFILPAEDGIFIIFHNFDIAYLHLFKAHNSLIILILTQMSTFSNTKVNINILILLQIILISRKW